MNSHQFDPPLDAIIIGAGQSGLCASYYLKQKNLHHLVLEKGHIGNCWLTQRWDSFILNSPNQMNLLPGESMGHHHPEAFISGTLFAEKLRKYASSNQLPVEEHTEVLSLEKSKTEDVFVITLNKEGKTSSLKARNVIIASGTQAIPKIPQISSQLPQTIHQQHSSQYRNPTSLPEGAVLIIGSATSGVQIAEDLLASNRKVLLSTSAVARVPRRYRGKDIMHWLNEMGFFTKPTAMAESREINMEAPLMSGVGEFGHTISLQSLQSQGAILLGYLDHADGYDLTFRNNLEEHLRFGDSFSLQVKQGIDQYIAASGQVADPPLSDAADMPVDIDLTSRPLLHINLLDKNISSIIWATGFDYDWKWIHLPVFDAEGKVIHKDGISGIPGLYFIGLPWQRNLKSSLIYGADEDAKTIAAYISKPVSHSWV